MRVLNHWHPDRQLMGAAANQEQARIEWVSPPRRRKHRAALVSSHQACGQCDWKAPKSTRRVPSLQLPRMHLLTSGHCSTRASQPLSTLFKLKLPMPPSDGDYVRNVRCAVLGDIILAPWYSSDYREDLVGGGVVDRLYICPHCFKYTIEETFHVAHIVRLDLPSSKTTPSAYAMSRINRMLLSLAK